MSQSRILEHPWGVFESSVIKQVLLFSLNIIRFFLDDLDEKRVKGNGSVTLCLSVLHWAEILISTWFCFLFFLANTFKFYLIVCFIFWPEMICFNFVVVGWIIFRSFVFQENYPSVVLFCHLFVLRFYFLITWKD